MKIYENGGKNMKQKKLFCTLLLLSSVMVTSSCSSSSGGSKEMKFEDLTVVYDGNSYSLEVENLPKGATVKYNNNSAKTEPGTYPVKAIVTLKDGTKEILNATLTIDKKESVLTAEAIQKASGYVNGVVPTYSLNNTEQSISVSPIYYPGTYTIDLYAAESSYYKESNHISVNFTVTEGDKYDVVFKSEDFVYDGTQKSLTATNVPAGFSVKYKNNTATEPGKYYASCEVYDTTDKLVSTINSIMKIDMPDNEAFNKYLDGFFSDYLGDDYITWNIFTANPENFGFEREVTDVAKWYSYEHFVEDDAYYKEAYDEAVHYKSLLTEFDVSTLSSNQLVSYHRIEGIFDDMLKLYNKDNHFSFFMDINYIDQFGGYPADFTTYMEAYELRREQDIKDVISYIESLPEAFASYVTYVQDRIDAGHRLSNYTLTEMCKYLSGVLDDGDNYYLSDYLGKRVDEVTFIDEKTKEAYKKQISSAIKNSFMPAHQSLFDQLKTKMSDEEDSKQYLTSYGEKGKAYYKYLLEKKLGYSNLNLDAYESAVYSTITKTSNKINSIIKTLTGDWAYSNKEAYNAFMSYMNGASMVGLKTPEEMLEYLKEFAKTIVKDLSTTPEIKVKYMDDSVAGSSNAVAYYMKSPLDTDNLEHITLNGMKLSDDLNDSLATLAHEGYPGHLYAYVHSKETSLSNIAKISTSTAHGEGWATYVQFKLYDYIKTHNAANTEAKQQAVELLCDYLNYNELLAYLAYTYTDYMIHIKDWTVSDVEGFFDQLGFSASAAEGVYLTLIEMPGNYACYGYGMKFFIDLHANAQSKLGELYDEVRFNEVIHSRGWVGLEELQQITDEYIEDTLYTYNKK